MAGDAVVFIPGIKGTQLTDTNRADWDTIWSGVQFNFESIEDLELSNPVQGVRYDEKIDSVIQPTQVEKLAYGEFLDDLETDLPVFIFSYDWRYSAVVNGARLDSFLTYLQQKSRASASISKAFKTFDFVTHSLGNAVLLNYLHNHGFGRVHKIVFTVPPFKGSIDIVSTALVGEGLFKGVKAKVRRILRTMPGALELLPCYDKASRFDSNRKHNFFNFKHWQSNVTEDGPIATKMKKALTLAKQTCKNELIDLNTLTKKQRDRILILVRGGYDTWQSVPITTETVVNGKPFFNLVDFESGLRQNEGDGRVPHVSSCAYADKIKTYKIEDGFFFREYDHGFFLKDERAQEMINSFLFRDELRSEFPGNSVQRVNGIEEKTKDGLPYWIATTD